MVDHSHPAGPIEEEFDVATKTNKTDDSKAFYEKVDDVGTFTTLVKFNSKNLPSNSIEEVKAQLREMNIID